jgi:hypothetical protein
VETIRVAEVLRVPSDGSCSAKQENNTISTKFRHNLPCSGRFPKPARKKSAQWPTTHITHEGHTFTIFSRRPHIRNMPCSVGGHFELRALHHTTLHATFVLLLCQSFEPSKKTMVMGLKGVSLLLSTNYLRWYSIVYTRPEMICPGTSKLACWRVQL